MLRLADSPATDDCVPDVLSLGANAQVHRIDADGSVAGVQDKHPFWDALPRMEFVGKTMNAGPASVDGDLPVPVRSDGPRPVDAAARAGLAALDEILVQRRKISAPWTHRSVQGFASQEPGVVGLAQTLRRTGLLASVHIATHTLQHSRRAVTWH